MFRAPALAFPSALFSLVALAAVAAVAGCGGEPAPKMVANTSNDGVPANSASEERLSNGGKPRPSAPAPEEAGQPYTTPVGGDPTPTTPTPTAATSGKAGKGGKNGASSTGKASSALEGGKVTKAECKQTFDKYIDLTVGTDSRFEGIPPEMIAQMKAQALTQVAAEKGDPCATQEVSRAQYSCAMASTSTSAWQHCMK